MKCKDEFSIIDRKPKILVYILFKHTVINCYRYYIIIVVFCNYTLD